MGIRVVGRRIETEAESWDLIAAPIENEKRPGTYIAPAVRASDGATLALPMPADIALAWFMANDPEG